MTLNDAKGCQGRMSFQPENIMPELIKWERSFLVLGLNQSSDGSFTVIYKSKPKVFKINRTYEYTVDCKEGSSYLLPDPLTLTGGVDDRGIPIRV